MRLDDNLRLYEEMRRNHANAFSFEWRNVKRLVRTMSGPRLAKKEVKISTQRFLSEVYRASLSVPQFDSDVTAAGLPSVPAENKNWVQLIWCEYLQQCVAQNCFHSICDTDADELGQDVRVFNIVWTALPMKKFVRTAATSPRPKIELGVEWYTTFIAQRHGAPKVLPVYRTSDTVFVDLYKVAPWGV